MKLFSILLLLKMLTMLVVDEGHAAGKGNFSEPKFPQSINYISFCLNGTLRGFTPKACPGGISFLKSPLEQETCFCHRGHYLFRAKKEEAEKLSWFVPFGIAPGKPRLNCVEISNTNISGGVYSIVPTLQDHIGAYNSDGSYRRVSAPWLKIHGNWTPQWNISEESDGKSQIKSIYFWSHPAYSHGTDSDLILQGADGKNVKCVSQIFKKTAQQETARMFATCKPSSKNLDKKIETWSISKAKKKSSLTSRFKFSETKNYAACVPPTAEDGECAIKPGSWLTRPVKSDWSQLSAMELHDRLKWEMEQLTEYRMRRVLQNAFINATENYPRPLKLLEIVTDIFGKVAKPLLNPKMLQMNYRLAEYLYYDSVSDDIMDDRDYFIVAYALNKCLKYLEFYVDPIDKHLMSCPINPAQGGEDKNTEKDTYPDGRGYVPSENDMIIELLWKGVDVAHSICFPHFTITKNSHHLFSVAMERFFSQEAIQYRWHRKITERQRKAYPVILPGLHEGTMEIADYIVQANFAINGKLVYNNWLRKPKIEMSKGKDSPQEEMKNGCPKSQVIWDGEACCHGYNQMQGIVPPLIKEISYLE